MKRVRVLYSRVQVGNKGDIITVSDDSYDSLISKGLIEDYKETRKTKTKAKVTQDQKIFDQETQTESGVLDGESDKKTDITN